MAKKLENLQNKAEYFEKNAMPYLIEHLKMRSTGLQIFTAVQGGLLVAWATRQHWSLAVLGLASCLSFYLWDKRNRHIFSILHRLGEDIVDKPTFGVGDDGRAVNGIHKIFLGTLSHSGRFLPIGKGGGFASHTWAIRVMLFSGAMVWVTLILTSIL